MNNPGKKWRQKWFLPLYLNVNQLLNTLLLVQEGFEKPGILVKIKAQKLAKRTVLPRFLQIL